MVQYRASNYSELKLFLDSKVELYNNSDFVIADPISIPHSYSRKQDIEITAFWTAILSWGRRQTIISKSEELFSLMGDSPYDFIVNHDEKDRAAFLDFKHRTFQPLDTLYFLEFLQYHYRKSESLESAFDVDKNEATLEDRLISFQEYFFSLDCAPSRTTKHVASPKRKSTCKRLNMFLRWMVRKDDCGVDFGIWNKIKMSELEIPLDVHVDRVARKLGLIKRKQRDWTAVKELTAALRIMDPLDPVKYDYALFGIGVMDKDNEMIQ